MRSSAFDGPWFPAARATARGPSSGRRCGRGIETGSSPSRPRWQALTCLAGTLDVLDGGLARRTGSASPRGAFVDSVVDRWAEAVTFLGIGGYFRDSWVALVVVGAAFSSQMVSYVRARAEGLGVVMAVGAVQRPERYVLLGFGAGLSAIASHLSCWALGTRQDLVLIGALWVLFGVSTWTAMERSRFAHARLREGSSE